MGVSHDCLLRMPVYLAGNQTRRENFDVVAETVVDPSEDPELHVVDADTTRELWSFDSELSPRWQTLLRALFTDNPLPYAEVAHICRMPTGGSDLPERELWSNWETGSNNISMGRKPDKSSGRAAMRLRLP